MSIEPESRPTAKFQPLYLKHRPQTLGELVGQESVVRTLTNAIENDRIAHAYLFTGPRGTGKTSSARILAKSINCQKGLTTEPCLTCASCTSIRDSSSPSVFELDAASNNSVDDARTLIERAPLVAQGGRKKIYIIDECHMLTKEAFNALLKTIEEPPPNVVFVLATTEEQKVPPTIVSRCQRLMFRLVTQKALSKHLRDVSTKESIEITDDAVELVARRAAGGLRDALGLLDQASLLARPGEPVSQSDLLVLLGALDEDVLMSVSKAVLERDGKSVIDSLNNLLSQGREPVLITVELAKHFLNLAKASYLNSSDGGKDASAGSYILGSPAYIAALTEQAKQFERAELSQIVTELEKLEQTLKKSTLSSLTLEMGLLSICHRHEIASVNSLSERLMKLEAQIASGEIGVRVDPRNVPDARTQAAAGAGSAGSPRPSGPPQRPQEALPHRQEQLPHRQEAASPRQEAAPAAPPPLRPQPAPPEPPRQDSSPPGQATPGSTQSNISQSNDDEGVFISEDSYDDEGDEEGGYSGGSGAYSGGSSSGPAPELRASIIETPVEQEPLPHHAGNDQQGHDDHGGGGSGDLDRIWSDLLDALHKRSIPAYSLVSTHAFPIRLEGGALTLGVRKEFFQKSIEAKTKQIEQAHMDITGQEVRVIVKVIADGGEGSQKGSGGSSGAASNPSPVIGNHERSQNREPTQSHEPLPHHNKSNGEPSSRESQSQGSPQRNESSYREPTSGESGGDDDDEGEPRGRTANNAMKSAAPERTATGYPSGAERSNSGYAGGAERAPQSTGGSSGGSYPESRASTAVAPSPTRTQQAAPRKNPDEDVPESSLIKEAYKLFEGPGSRLIG